MENQKKIDDLNDNTKQLNICDSAEDTVDGSAGNQVNWKGYLLEQQTKKRLQVSFDPPVKSGLDHTPNYEVRCVITSDTRDIVGVGSGSAVKEATQNAAKEAAEHWQQLISGGENSQQSIGGNSVVTENKELQKFYSGLTSNEDVAAYLLSNQNDSQTLENILSLMGCKSDVVLGNTEKSVLIKIALRDHESVVVMTAFAVSDRSTDEAKQTAEQKAIAIIKILINN